METITYITVNIVREIIISIMFFFCRKGNCFLTMFF
jgi:hypothetical protein